MERDSQSLYQEIASGSTTTHNRTPRCCRNADQCRWLFRPRQYGRLPGAPGFQGRRSDPATNFAVAVGPNPITVCAGNLSTPAIALHNSPCDPCSLHQDTQRVSSPNSLTVMNRRGRQLTCPQASRTSSRTRAASAWPAGRSHHRTILIAPRPCLPPRIFASATWDLRPGGPKSTAAWVNESSRTNASLSQSSPVGLTSPARPHPPRRAKLLDGLR